MALDRKTHGSRMAVAHLVVSALAWGLTNPARSEPLPASVRACRSQVDELQRLRCYDAAVDSSARSSKTSVPSPDVTSSLRGPVEPADGAVAAHAGSPAAPAVRPATASTPLPMFNAKVAALSFRPSGAVNVVLDNGQTWTQYGPEGRVPLRTGDTVTLRPGLFGASVLVGPSGWITKVHLIQTAAAEASSH